MIGAGLESGGRDAAEVASRPPVLCEEEAWGLDQLGNWGTCDIDDTDNGLDLNQEREHNAANEVGTITVAQGGVGTNWVDPVHDAKGNMTTMPKGWSPASGLTCVYDAWNRLVEVKDGATTVGRYEYDGLGRRAVSGVSSAARAAPPGGVDVWRHFFYNAAWQVLETRVAATSGAGAEGSVPEVQYVWSERYIDAAVLRDENLSDGSGGAADGDCEDGDDERLYYTTDANMNVTSLLDDTGAAVERYEYTAYGQATVYNSDWSAEVSWSSSKRNAVRYCGYLWDWESDLYTVRYRVYTALVGRWGQRDPIGYEDGTSLYGAYFVPTSTDPSGLDSFDGVGDGLYGAPDPNAPGFYLNVPGCKPPGGFAPATDHAPAPPPNVKRVIIVSTHTVDWDELKWIMDYFWTGDIYRLGTKRGPSSMKKNGKGRIPGKIVETAAVQLADLLEKRYPNRCIEELNLSGHGHGAGVSTDKLCKDAINENMDSEAADRIAKKLCPGAVVNLCGCSTAKDESKLQKIANKLRARTCGCTGGVASPCKCHGEWRCKEPQTTRAGNEDGKEK